MSEIRYLVRLANERGLLPADKTIILNELRRRMGSLPGAATNIRVGTKAIEFELFGPPDLAAKPYEACWAPLGRLITWRPLDHASGAPDPRAVVSEARQLFNEERYWEVHE